MKWCIVYQCCWQRRGDTRVLASFISILYGSNATIDLVPIATISNDMWTALKSTVNRAHCTPTTGHQTTKHGHDPLVLNAGTHM